MNSEEQLLQIMDVLGSCPPYYLGVVEDTPYHEGWYVKDEVVYKLARIIDAMKEELKEARSSAIMGAADDILGYVGKDESSEYYKQFKQAAQKIKENQTTKNEYLYPTDEAVYVYADDSNYSRPPSYMSDDYEVRVGAYCEKCDSEVHLHYGEPLASCECGTQEWFK